MNQVEQYFSLIRDYIEAKQHFNFSETVEDEDSEDNALSDETSDDEDEEGAFESEGDESNDKVNYSYDNNLEKLLRCFNFAYKAHAKKPSEFKDLMKDLTETFSDEPAWDASVTKDWVDLCNILNNIQDTGEGDDPFVFHIPLIFNGTWHLESIKDRFTAWSATKHSFICYMDVKAAFELGDFQKKAEKQVNDLERKGEIRSYQHTAKVQEYLEREIKDHKFVYEPCIVQYNSSKHSWMVYSKILGEKIKFIDLSDMPEEIYSPNAIALILRSSTENKSRTAYILADDGKNFDVGTREIDQQRNKSLESAKSSTKSESGKKSENTNGESQKNSNEPYISPKYSNLYAKAPDDFSDIYLTEAKKKFGQQSDSRDCLIAMTRYINNYTSSRWGGQFYYPPEGNTEQAHCIIDELGHQTKENKPVKTHPGKKVTTVEASQKAEKAALTYIDYCLDHKLPVLVGLNYREDTYTNNDHVTDHFSAIFGKRQDNRGYLYYSMWDVATAKEVRLYLNKKTQILEVPDNQGESAGKQKHDYQVTQVRVYPAHVKHFKEITKMDIRTAQKLPRKGVETA